MQRMLEILWYKKGSISATARWIGFSPQQLVNWRGQGYVPLKHTFNLSQIFKISPNILNPNAWKSCKEFPGDIKKAFNREESSYILKGKLPL